jgi:hypothetical protein
MLSRDTKQHYLLMYHQPCMCHNLAACCNVHAEPHHLEKIHCYCSDVLVIACNACVWQSFHCICCCLSLLEHVLSQAETGPMIRVLHVSFQSRTGSHCKSILHSSIPDHQSMLQRIMQEVNNAQNLDCLVSVSELLFTIKICITCSTEKITILVTILRVLTVLKAP